MIVEYSVPLTQSAQLDGDFMIEGIAINSTTTANGHTFLGEELQKSAQTMIGVPLLKDHNNSVDSIVGKVQGARFDEDLGNIPFKAVVKDPAMKEKIKQGLINSVSIGAHVDPKDIEEGDDGTIIPRNIVFKELSLVAVPADAGATFGVALNNAYKTFTESLKNDNIKEAERGLANMSENKTETQIVEETSPNFEETMDAIKALTEQVEALKAEVESLKVQEADVDESEEKSEEDTTEVQEGDSTEEEATEEKSEEVEEEAAQEESEDDEVVEERGYNIIQEHDSFAYKRPSYTY